MGPYYQAFPEGGSLTIYEDDPARTYDADRQVVQEGRRRVAGVERLARGHRRGDGPAAHPGAAEHRLAPAGRPARRCQAGLEPAQGIDVRTTARRHPADDDEHRRPARRLVRVAADQGRAGGQRRHRHLGRPVRAGHRLRHGAPLDRRRRRRAARQLGLSRGRHGRRVRGHRGARRASFGAEIRTNATASSGCSSRGGAVRGRRARERRRDARAARRHHAAPEDRVPRPDRRAATCPTTSSATSSAGRPAAAS